MRNIAGLELVLTPDMTIVEFFRAVETYAEARRQEEAEKEEELVENGGNSAE